jgi:hypothetical protein
MSGGWRWRGGPPAAVARVVSDVAINSLPLDDFNHFERFTMHYCTYFQK